MQRSATETVGLIGVEPRGEQLVDDFCGLEEGKEKSVPYAARLQA